MQKKPVISVVIPVYNAEKYIGRCLTSVLNNSWKELEVICIDDGSTDSSSDILDRFTFCDSRVVVIAQKNSGVSVARNRGLEIARGEYIAFIDADDWVHEQFLEQLLSCIIDANCGVVCCDYEKVTEGEPIPEDDCSSDQQSSLEMLSVSAFSNNFYLRSKCWGKLYRRNLIEGISFPEEVALGEDTIFVLDCLQRIKGKIPVLHRPLYYYSDNSDSSLHRMDETALLNTVDYYLSLKAHPNCKLRKSYVIDGMKKMLVARYEHQIRDHFPKSKMVPYNRRMRKLIGMLRSSGYGKTPEYLLYTLFFRLPWFYRLFRIVMDPSMIRYERGLREN